MWSEVLDLLILFVVRVFTVQMGNGQDQRKEKKQKNRRTESEKKIEKQNQQVEARMERTCHNHCVREAHAEEKQERG